MVGTILVSYAQAKALWAVIKETPDAIGVVCYKLTVTWPPKKKCQLAASMLESMAQLSMV